MKTLMLAAETTPISYLPVLLQLIIGAGIVIVIMIASAMLGPKRNTSDKLINFESGIPSIGNARQPMGIKYFLTAILFVLFDVEIIFFYPYAVNFKNFLADGNGATVFFEVILFVAFFLCGFIYIVKKGALDWEE